MAGPPASPVTLHRLIGHVAESLFLGLGPDTVPVSLDEHSLPAQKSERLHCPLPQLRLARAVEYFLGALTGEKGNDLGLGFAGVELDELFDGLGSLGDLFAWHGVHAVLLANATEEMTPELGLDGVVAKLPTTLAQGRPLLPEGDGERSGVVDGHVDLERIHRHELSPYGDVLNGGTLVTGDDLVARLGVGAIGVVGAVDSTTHPRHLLVHGRGSASMETTALEAEELLPVVV